MQKHAIAIAHHFNFRPLEELNKQKPSEIVRETNTGALPNVYPDIDPHAEEAKRVFNYLADRNRLPPAEPLFIYWNPRTGRSTFALAAIGTPLSIAEALLIKMGCLIAGGGKPDDDVSVSIGSMGDKDSAARFAREALAVLRKHEHTLPRETRLMMRDNAFRAIRHIHDHHPEIAEHLPSPMDYLADKSRQHFREVLLHLEAADIPYTMKSSLVGHPEWHSETMFEIRNASEGAEATEDTLYARGARYDEYARRLAKFRTHGVMLFFAGKNIRGAKPSFPKERKPFAFFIHIGFEARLFGVGLMESLRGSHIPIRHTLGTAGFREQLEKAETLQVPYAIIMGQKEANDKIVIVRDMLTREQEYVPVADLPKRLAQLASRKRR